MRGQFGSPGHENVYEVAVTAGDDNDSHHTLSNSNSLKDLFRRRLGDNWADYQWDFHPSPA